MMVARIIKMKLLENWQKDKRIDLIIHDKLKGPGGQLLGYKNFSFDFT